MWGGLAGGDLGLDAEQQNGDGHRRFWSLSRRGCAAAVAAAAALWDINNNEQQRRATAGV